MQWANGMEVRHSAERQLENRRYWDNLSKREVMDAALQGLSEPLRGKLYYIRQVHTLQQLNIQEVKRHLGAAL